MAGRAAPRKIASFGVAVAAVAACALAQWPLEAQQQDVTKPATPGRPCRVRGVVESGGMPLPGASVTARDGDRVVAVTSTDVDGSYVLSVAPGSYIVRVELSAFASTDQAVTLGQPPCEAQSSARLGLVSRVPGYVPPAPVVASAGTAGPARGTDAPGTGRAGQNGRFGAGGRLGGANRFQSLTVQQSSAAEAAPETAVELTTGSLPADDPATRLLPPGFSTNAPQESVTVNGTFVDVDRNQMNDRIAALGRGEFGLAEGQQFGAGGQAGTQVGFGDAFGAGGGGAGGRGGPGGPGGFGFAGRGAGANRTQVSATYGLGGSMFDSAPYSLSDGAIQKDASQKPNYLQQNFSTTVGGALKIPHIYNGANRTTYNFSYTGSHNNNLVDQYGTVPSEAYRAGDFSASATAIIDPVTGNPFPGNQIPANRLNPASLALLRFIPTANVDSETRNYHLSDTSRSDSDQFTLRLTHSITAPQTGRGGRGGGRGGAQGAAQQPAAGRTTAAGQTAGGAQGGQTPGRGQNGAAGNGRGGRGNFQPPLNVSISANISYRRNTGDRSNIYPLLAGTTKGSTFSAPVTLNIRAGRSIHVISGTFSRTTSETLSPFAYTQDVAGQAGIQGVSTNPFDWGVPSLSFSTYTALRDTSPSQRHDHSWGLNYGLTRPSGTHTYRMGGSYQQQVSRTQSDSNARGSFTFTGLYTANGLSTVRDSGQDFADFLLGLPQQATRQYSLTPDNISSPVSIVGRQFNLYLQDDWRWKAKWTINYGLQYDFVAPYVETEGHMVNLDAAPDFTAVATVQPGDVGPYSGKYSSGLVNPDWNNLAPRVGLAWRTTNRSVIRAGYGLSYNSGAYATIARNLYQQPPFFQTGTSVGTLATPLTITDAFANIAASTITNNYGIDKNYELGLIHQWTTDYSRDLFRTWSMGATYFGTRGAHLDVLRAPNRGPTGLRISGVEAFTWQSSEGSSYMNGVALRLQKRQSHGISGTATYTLSRSRDNTTATGGSATVAQNDQDLEAEWALSNFDRRHQFNGTATLELPFGRNRHWLSTGGLLAAIAGGWSMSANLNWQSGTPLTARCSSCAADVATGVVGTLRADATGQAIALANPTIDAFFNKAAFAIPAAGTFGTSGRNVIIGPGSHVLNAQFTRDLALGQNRNVSINVNANNLLNTVNFASIDTNVNSLTFGQVLAVNGRRTVRVNLRFRF